MTPFFDRFDAIPELEFALWFALLMLGIGLVIGAVIVIRWVWRKVAGARRARRERKEYDAQLDRELNHRMREYWRDVLW